MDGFGVVREEIQDAPALLNVGFGVGAQAVHQVHKLDAVPDEEYLHSQAENLLSHLNVVDLQRFPASQRWISLVSSP